MESLVIFPVVVVAMVVNFVSEVEDLVENSAEEEMVVAIKDMAGGGFDGGIQGGKDGGYNCKSRGFSREGYVGDGSAG